MALSQLLNTDTETLRELLGNGKTHKVPEYQRDYSWKQENWEDLWEDLEAIESSQEDHYMGAIVLETSDRKNFLIIDGQQRIATLSILILACIDYLQDLVNQGIDEQANLERMTLLETGYIGAKDPASLRLIPKLALNRNDDHFFQLNLAQSIAPIGLLMKSTLVRQNWPESQKQFGCFPSSPYRHMGGVSGSTFLQLKKSLRHFTMARSVLELAIPRVRKPRHTFRLGMILL
jgi:hypothetical protein